MWCSNIGFVCIRTFTSALAVASATVPSFSRLPDGNAGDDGEDAFSIRTSTSYVLEGRAGDAGGSAGTCGTLAVVNVITFSSISANLRFVKLGLLFATNFGVANAPSLLASGDSDTERERCETVSVWTLLTELVGEVACEAIRHVTGEARGLVHMAWWAGGN